MIFNSLDFLLWFPVIFIAYHLVVPKVRKPKIRWGNLFLLALSYLLYMKWNPPYVLILFGVTAVTYLTALAIERQQTYGKRRYIATAGVLLTLLPILVFKYYNFLNDTMSHLLSAVGITAGLPGLNWAIPMGISFFTFQALGYLFDVYYKRIKAERNWWDYMLFVSFFPQIASGPISKASDLLPQFKSHRPFSYEGAVQGLKWLLWGMVLKTVMADRLGIYVDTVFGHYGHYSGATCLLASIFYTFQIYGDFAGYSLMAIGTGRLLGFDLINNFRRPYLAVSITDFWRRWHISLSIWLKDYVYIPLGGNRCTPLRNYGNILTTFLVSGIWHGANWTFIAWGVLHGLFQIAEKYFGFQRFEGRPAMRMLRIAATFLLVNFAWIFFRMPTIGDALQIISRIWTEEGGLFMDTKTTMLLCFASLAGVATADIISEYSRLSLFSHKNIVVRWASYIACTLTVMLCGVLDSGQFIYVSF